MAHLALPQVHSGELLESPVPQQENLDGLRCKMGTCGSRGTTKQTGTSGVNVKLPAVTAVFFFCHPKLWPWFQPQETVANKFQNKSSQQSATKVVVTGLQGRLANQLVPFEEAKEYTKLKCTSKWEQDFKAQNLENVNAQSADIMVFNMS